MRADAKAKDELKEKNPPSSGRSPSGLLGTRRLEGRVLFKYFSYNRRVVPAVSGAPGDSMGRIGRGLSYGD